MKGHIDNLSTFDGGISSPEYPVTASEKGWIEPPPRSPLPTSSPSPHNNNNNSVDDSSTPPPPPPTTTTTYRVIYNWSGPPEEAFWTAEFIRIPYMLTGHRAHWIALAAHRVVGTPISLRQETKWDFMEEKEEEDEEEDEDMGF